MSSDINKQIRDAKAQLARLEAQALIDGLETAFRNFRNAKGSEAVSKAQQELYKHAKTFCNREEKARRAEKGEEKPEVPATVPPAKKGAVGS